MTATDGTAAAGDHCDGWHGVVCDLKGRVVEVNLGGNGVVGRIPVEISLLTELGTLDLSDNRLTGEVPGEALSSPRLYSALLNGNGLAGEFPFSEVKPKGGSESSSLLSTLWIQENPGLGGAVTEEYCGMGSMTLDCDGFDPQPTYDADGDGSLTTFEAACERETGTRPGEYTCNFDDGAGDGAQPAGAGEAAEADGGAPYCGIPAAGA